MTDYADKYKYGLEFELIVTDKSFRPLHYGQLDYEKMRQILEGIDVPQLDYLKIKYPGSSQKPYYLEGYDITDAKGDFVTLKVKGVEIATPIFNSAEAVTEGLSSLYSLVQKQLVANDLNCCCLGIHPVDFDFEGPRGARQVPNWASAEIAMTTSGIHVNVSMPTALEEKLDREATKFRFNYAAPALVLVSANTPFKHSEPWMINGKIGKSNRSYRRSFTRDTLYFRDDQNYRKEVTIFDMTNSLPMVAGYSALTMGLMLDDKPFPYIPDTFCQENVRRVALDGYDALVVDRQFKRLDMGALAEEILERASRGLRQHDLDDVRLDPLRKLVAARRTPSDDMADAWSAQSDWPSFMERYSKLSPLE